MYLLFLALIAVGVVLISLGLPNQAWRTAPLSAPRWRVAAAVCMALGMACGLAYLSLVTVVLMALAVSMVVVTAVPFLALLRSKRNSR